MLFRQERRQLHGLREDPRENGRLRSVEGLHDITARPIALSTSLQHNYGARSDESGQNYEAEAHSCEERVAVLCETVLSSAFRGEYYEEQFPMKRLLNLFNSVCSLGFVVYIFMENRS